jgi:hypothetical protein
VTGELLLLRHLAKAVAIHLAARDRKALAFEVLAADPGDERSKRWAEEAAHAEEESAAHLRVSLRYTEDGQQGGRP